MSKEIRELLEETKKCVELWQIRHKYNVGCECNKCRAITRIDQILSLLPEPCKRCGDTDEALEALSLLSLWAGCFDYKRFVAGEIADKCTEAEEILTDFINDKPEPSSDYGEGTIIGFLKEGRQIHVNWRDWLKEYPDEADKPEYSHVGDIEYHEKWILQYDKVIAFIDQQAGTIKELKTIIEDVKLELSCPETVECANKKEPLYKWAALICCIKLQQADRIKELEDSVTKRALNYRKGKLKEFEERIEELEELYAAATKALNSQIEQNRWIQKEGNDAPKIGQLILLYWPGRKHKDGNSDRFSSPEIACMRYAKSKRLGSIPKGWPWYSEFLWSSSGCGHPSEDLATHWMPFDFPTPSDTGKPKDTEQKGE